MTEKIEKDFYDDEVQRYRKTDHRPIIILFIFDTFFDICSCLSLIHSLGFVHGDIKLANILWSAQHDMVKVIDYGLSYHVDDKVSDTQHTVYIRHY